MPQSKQPLFDYLLVPPFDFDGEGSPNRSKAKLSFNCYVHGQAPGSGNPPLPKSGKQCPGAGGEEDCHPSSLLALTSCVSCGTRIPEEGRARLSTLAEWRERFEALSPEDKDKYNVLAGGPKGLVSPSRWSSVGG